MKRLYMCDKPGHHGWPHCKSRTANSILFEKEDIFLYDFRVSHWPAVLRAGISIAMLKLNTYMYIYIYIYMSTKTLIIDLGVALEVQTFLIYTEML